MNFFRDVVSHLLKTAFEGHTKFSVADNTAVGENPIRSISLDAVPAADGTIVSLSWEGGEKLFEKNLPDQEASHQFDLISTDLAEVAALTKQGQYDAAKDLMKKLGQKYAENTGEIVETNLPKLHNTQASQSICECIHPANKHEWEDSKRPCENCGCKNFIEDMRKKASQEDDKIWREAKITMQNLWFSTTDELLEYQKKQKDAQPKVDQDHIPLWDKQKGKAPKEELAPASLSYEDAEKAEEKEHEDMQKHIDETIKTELESALQQKAASVFGPDQVELVEVLRKNGRNWDEIKKILIKDFGFDKDSTNIFVDEQRQGADPTGIEVEPIDEEEKPLTPPEELVSPETHDKLLKDHEDKKKDNNPVEEPNFTPKEIMDIPEDEIQDESSLVNEIARADNDDIHKVASDSHDHTCPKCDKVWKCYKGDACHERKSALCGKHYADKEFKKKAAPSDLNPLQEPIEQEPTTPNQDTVPMSKTKDHHAPQKGDRVFVSSDLTGEKAGFQGTFISSYQSKGIEFSIVETDQGDLLDVESHRVTKTSDADGQPGAQVAEPVMEPELATQKEDDIQVTPKMTDFQSSQDQALTLKAEVDALFKLVKDADFHPALGGTIVKHEDHEDVKEGTDTETNDELFECPKGSGKMRWEVKNVEVSQKESNNDSFSMKCSDCKTSNLDYDELQRHLVKSHGYQVADAINKVKTIINKKAANGSACIKCDKVYKLEDMVKNEHGAGYLCKSHASEWNKEASLKKEAGTTWYDIGLPDPPENAVRVQHVSGLGGTIVSFSDKMANAKLDQKIKNDEATCRQLEISWVQLERGDHPKGVYAIYVYGFEARPGVTPNWTLLDANNQPIYPEGYKPMDHDKNPNPEPAIDTESALKTAFDFEKGISQNKTADPVDPAKTQFKDYKVTPKYVPKQEAVPATPEIDAVLTKMANLEQNLATLDTARKQIEAKMKEEMAKVDQSGNRVEMEAALQESIEKAAILISAVESKVVQWKDKLYTLQTEEISYVPKLTPKEMLSKIYAKFDGAEKYVQDVLNGMLSQAKNVMENTLIRWPNKKSSLNKEATLLDDMNHYNDELMAALRELSSPL